MDDKDRKYLDYFKRLDDSSDSNEPVVFKTTCNEDYFLQPAALHKPITVAPDDDVPFDAMAILNIAELLDDRKS